MANSAKGTNRDKQGKSFVESQNRGPNFTAQEVFVSNNQPDPVPVNAFIDHNGNMTYLQLDPAGALPTTTVSGTPFTAHNVLLIANQVKDSFVRGCFVQLDVDDDEIVTYNKPDFKVTSFAETRVKLELIIDEGLGSEDIIELGYGALSDIQINDKQRIVNNFAEVPAGSTTAELRLMIKAYEDGNQADDVDCSISINKVPVNTP